MPLLAGAEIPACCSPGLGKVRRTPPHKKARRVLVPGTHPPISFKSKIFHLMHQNYFFQWFRRNGVKYRTIYVAVTTVWNEQRSGEIAQITRHVISFNLSCLLNWFISLHSCI